MINVVYHCSNEYATFLLLSIYSVAKHTISDIRFHILHVFDDEKTKSVQSFLTAYKINHTLVRVDEQLLDDLKVPHTYYRLLKKRISLNLYEFQKAHHMLAHKEVDFTHPTVFFFILHEKLYGYCNYIFLNCDTIATTDINELYTIPTEKDKICLMRSDWANKTFIRNNLEYKHYNPSVTKVSSSEIYQYIEQAYVNTLHNVIEAKFAMQHDFCVVAKDKIQDLDYYWNYSVKQNEPLKNHCTPYIIHYNTVITNQNKIKNHPLYSELQNIAFECKINSYDCEFTS